MINELPELPPKKPFKVKPFNAHENVEEIKMQAEPRPDLVAKYSLFRDRFHPRADVVYHPCGANDVSPSSVFQGSRVVYAEIDPKSVEALRAGNFEVHDQSAETFDPGEVDVLILLNPSIDASVPLSHVKNGGFVICNNYHGTASNLIKNNQFEFKGIIRKTSEGIVLDEQDLDDCWREVETDEEFKKADKNLFACVSYDVALSVVSRITGKTDNILKEYKKLIDLAKEQKRNKDREILKEVPDAEDLLNDTDELEALILEHNGERIPLITGIPKKKGTVDDIFIFQKS